MPQKDQFFYFSSLFSQSLSSLEPILKETSCMNPEDGELVGLLKIAIRRAKNRNQLDRAKRLEDKSLELQILGMSKWIKGEVTNLGFRLGHRDQQSIVVGTDTKKGDQNGDSSTIRMEDGSS